MTTLHNLTEFRVIVVLITCIMQVCEFCFTGFNLINDISKSRTKDFCSRKSGERWDICFLSRRGGGALNVVGVKIFKAG